MWDEDRIDRRGPPPSRRLLHTIMKSLKLLIKIIKMLKNNKNV